MSQKFLRILELNRQAEEGYTKILDALEVARQNIILCGGTIDKETNDKIQIRIRNIRQSINDTSRQIPFVENGKHYDDSLGKWQRKVDTGVDRWLKLNIVPDWVLNRKVDLNFLLAKFDEILMEETGTLANISLLEAHGRFESEMQRQDKKAITQETAQDWLKRMRKEEPKSDSPEEKERIMGMSIEAAEAELKLFKMLGWLSRLFHDPATKWEELPENAKVVLQELENEVNSMRFLLAGAGITKEISDFIDDNFGDLRTLVAKGNPLVLAEEIQPGPEDNSPAEERVYVRHGSKSGVVPSKFV